MLSHAPAAVAGVGMDLAPGPSRCIWSRRAGLWMQAEGFETEGLLLGLAVVRQFLNISCSKLDPWGSQSAQPPVCDFLAPCLERLPSWPHFPELNTIAVARFLEDCGLQASRTCFSLLRYG